MKNSKIIFFLAVLFTASLAFSSCGNKSSDAATPEVSETTDTKEVVDADAKQGKEYTSAYVCPMHCEGSGSDVAGKCPVCGMDYVQNEDHKADEHDHDDHEGHDH
jgi:hypothetical protein